MLVCLKTVTTKEKRASAYSLTRAAVNLGFLFGPVLGGLIIMQSGYEYIFYADGATCILAIIVFMIFVREKQLPIKTAAERALPKNVSVMKDKQFYSFKYSQHCLCITKNNSICRSLIVGCC
jgi:MFS family permease